MKLIIAMLTAAVAVAITFGQMVVEAVVGVQLWAWFMVPLGLPAITMAHWIGVNVVLGLFAWRYIPVPDGHAGLRAFSWAMMVALAYIVGYAASRLML